jgi:hypothetical protein
VGDISSPTEGLQKRRKLLLHSCIDGEARHSVVDQGAANDLTKDPVSYRIAVGAFGLALLGFVTMAGIAVALGAQVPDKFWILGTTIAGVLTGILVPPTQAQQDAQARQEAQAPLKARAAQGDAHAIGLLRDAKPDETHTQTNKYVAWAQRQDWRLIVLGALFVVCGVAGLVLANTAHQGATQLFAVAGTTGAAALGILVPSPKTNP